MEKEYKINKLIELRKDLMNVLNKHKNQIVEKGHQDEHNPELLKLQKHQENLIRIIEKKIEKLDQE